MIALFLTGLTASALLIISWGALLAPVGWPLLPLGALAVLPTLYFNWRENLLWLLPLGLIWEAHLPLPFGSVAIPLTLASLGLQLLLRHQLRSSAASQAFTAVLLQSVVAISLSVIYPPQSAQAIVRQSIDVALALAMAAILAPLITHGFARIAQKRFDINLDSRLKDL
jgi:hypothetical protein